MLLKVENLKIAFGVENPVVDNISFSLDEKETLGIVGESGSGKSLTALSIIGLLPESATIISGNVNFYSENRWIDLLSLSEREKRNFRGNIISMIFQEPMSSLNPSMKCGRQVAEVLKFHKKISAKEAHEFTIGLFNEVKLPEPEKTFNKYPHQLSGGQRQRIMIAMAVACKPKILLADEPTTALDVMVQKSILELIQTLQEKYGLSIIFISHDLGVISKISHKVLVLQQGKQIEFGLTKDVFTNPVAPYTKGLIACRPRIDVRPKKLRVVSDFLSGVPVSSQVEGNIDRKERHKLIYSQAPILKLKNLNTYFHQKYNIFNRPIQSFRALNDINLEVWRGETLGLVGESGSGKSTLGRSLMRLIETVTGNIIYNGLDINTLNKKELKFFRSKFQLIFQDPDSSLDPGHSIGYSIMEPMIVHNICSNDKERKHRVLELLEKTGLQTDWFKRYPHQLSGGQRQRVAIARALSTSPEFLICDESISALDISIQAQILNLLNQLKEELNLTYIFISHDLAVVRFMSDRIVVLDKGQIVETGEADELCKSPTTAYTRNLLNAAL